MASSAERDALELMEKGDKKAGSSGWFSGPKRDEAAELYARAANQYKLIKRWKEAGDAYSRAAQMQMMIDERDEAAQTFISAAKCYKKVTPEDAVVSLKQAVEILTDHGRFHAAATQMRDIAQIYEADLNDLNAAMQSYETAADWFNGEEAVSLANQCLLKVATFAAEVEQYDRAIEKFEGVAASSLDSQLTKWSLKEYFLKAGLCHLCKGDPVGLQRALEHYCEMDITFRTTRECKVLQDIAATVEAGDVEAFTQHVVEFDQLTKLDEWKTRILLRIKKSIVEEPDFT